MIIYIPFNRIAKLNKEMREATEALDLAQRNLNRVERKKSLCYSTLLILDFGVGQDGTAESVTYYDILENYYKDLDAPEIDLKADMTEAIKRGEIRKFSGIDFLSDTLYELTPRTIRELYED